MSDTRFFATKFAIAASFSVMTLAACVNQPITQPSTNPPASTQPGTPSTTPLQPGTVTPPDVSAPATVHGLVYDDLQQRISDATVTAKVLSGAGKFANGSDTLTTTTQVGSYSLASAPAGCTILVTVSKPGYTSREQTIIPLSNLQGNPSANQLDFGMRNGAADATTAMSDKPEIQAVTPPADATNVDQAAAFTLTFSEPMNKNDVETNFAVAVATDTAAGYTLSNGVNLPQQYSPANDQFGAAALANANNVILSSSDFNFNWSNNDKTVTISYLPGQKLPSDKDTARVPQYAVGFLGALRDASGSGTRSDKFFRTQPAQAGKNGCRFTVAADTTAPRLIGAIAVNNATTNGGNDQMRLQYSETMVLYPRNLGGGATAIPNAITTPERSALTLGNYEWTYQIAKPASYGAGSAFGGSAAFWDGDGDRTTIVLNHNNSTAFNSGAVWAGVASTVEDPAGNRIETQNGANLKSGNAV
jgi:hypothetical protein